MMTKNKICEHCVGKFDHEIKIFNNEPSRLLNGGHCFERKGSKITCFERFISIHIQPVCIERAIIEMKLQKDLGCSIRLFHDKEHGEENKDLDSTWTGCVPCKNLFNKAGIEK